MVETTKLKKFNESLKSEISRLGPVGNSLLKSSELYRTLYEESPSMFFIVSTDGEIISVNKFGAKHLGYKVKDLIGQSVFDIFHERDRNAVYNKVQQYLRNNEKVGKWEFRKTRKDGSILWVREVVRTVHQGDSGPFLVIECDDITEEKRTEKILKANFEKISKMNRYETIISKITRIIHQSIDLEEVLDNAVDAMNRNIKGVDNVSIFIVEGKVAVLKSYRGYSEWAIKKVMRIPYPKGFTWKTIIDGKPMYCPDVEKDTVIGPAGREIGTKSYASIPIVFEGKPVGSLNINSYHKNAFDSEELTLIETVAEQIGVAIKNANQAEALRKSERELSRINRDLELRVKERTRKLTANNKKLRTEVSKRKIIEEQIKSSLNEKEILLREIQHRVKNNLQIISSMLNLQSDNVNDKNSIGMLREIKNRVRSMALLHQQIYESNDLTKIDLHVYLRNLANNLMHSYGKESKDITLGINVVNSQLDVDKAILCGQIVNELVSNSLKHAFPNGNIGEEKEISIELYPFNGNCILVISDNGVGLKRDSNFRRTKTLGLQLVLALTKQLDGEIRISKRNGTSFRIKFPEK